VSRSGLAARSAVVALLAVAPYLLDNYRTFLLTEILVFGLFAASLDLLIGYAGLASLGHGGYFGVGAYAAGLLALHATSNAFAQIAVAAGVAAGVALVTGMFAVRSRGVYFLMLTLAFGQLLWVLALNWASLTGGSNGIYGIPAPALAGKSRWLVPTDHFYWYTLGVFLVGYAVLQLIVGSPFGRALAAIRENETRMRSLGYNVPLYKLAVFTVAGGIAGYAGALACQQPRFFSPEGMSFEVSAVAVVAIIIGGQRSLLGAVLGAAVYYVLRDQLSGVLSSHWELALGATFVLVVYLLPGGIVGGGRWVRRRVTVGGGRWLGRRLTA
jgi:branched-chain amino acid transport system permease protein